jgi:hypothetical protein
MAILFPSDTAKFSNSFFIHSINLRKQYGQDI